MCVTFKGEEEMAAIAKIFDLLLLALKEKQSKKGATESGSNRFGTGAHTQTINCI